MATTVEPIVLSFLLGASLGSFLNVCAYRIPRQLSVVRNRSFCPSCRRILRWYELIPVVSFLLCRGRCLRCHMAISLQYPVMEFLSGAVAVTVVLTSGLSVESLFPLAFVLVMLLVAVIDFRHLLIPNKVILWGSGLAAAFRGIAEPSALLPAFLALAASFSMLLLIRLVGNALFRKESLGMGDVKLAGLIGFALGLPALVISLWLAAIGGLIYGSVRAHILKSQTFAGNLVTLDGEKIPFGSFLALSSALLAFVEITAWDFTFFLEGGPWMR